MIKAHSLAFSITAALTAGLTVLMFFLALYINREIKHELYDTINRKNLSVLSLQADNAALPLWNYDVKQLQVIVENIAKGEDIQSARIVSVDGNIDVLASNPQPMDPAYAAASLESEIMFSGNTTRFNVGTLTIVPNYEKLAKRLERQAIEILAGTVFLLLLLVGGIYIIVKRAIAPVTHLSSFMSAASTDTPAIETVKSPIIEVQLLSSALQKMQNNYLLYQQELVDEKEKAENANRVKSDFLATMSHELRTPLNSIIGLSDMFIKDMALDAEHHDMAVIIRKSSIILLNIINDILDISKIESGKIELEKTDFNLKETIDSVMQTLLPLASLKRLVLSCHYTLENLAGHVHGDPVRISRVLTNLIGNAIKYTEQGSIDVDIKTRAGEGGALTLECRIRDTGIGIPEDKLPVIFEKFTQADGSITRKYGGTGLGLAISKEIVVLMDGEIGVESIVGEGSTFWFRIPLGKARPAQNERQAGLDTHADSLISRKDISAVRVLVAEDHMLNQIFIKKLMARMGAQADNIVVRDNGKLALEAYHQGHYDLILMDCHMPEMNGYDATIAVRKDENKRDTPVRIVAMTADAMVGTREKCLAVGMDDYISKPVDSAKLKTILERWFVFSDELEKPVSADDKHEEDVSYVDMSRLRDYADTPEEEKAYIELFISQAEKDLQRLKEQCTDGENMEWRDIAHKLKGGAAVAGATVMHTLCKDAQEMLIATEGERKEKFQEIIAAYEKTKSAFEKILKDQAA